MTHSVSFHFCSPQFVFNSGIVVFFKGARLRSDGGISTGELRAGSIDHVLVEGPIEFDAMLYQLNVTRREGSRSYDITCHWITHAMTTQAIASGRIDVELHVPVVLVVRVEDSSGNPVSDAIVSASVPSLTATLEIPLTGEMVLLGMPGRYSFRLASAGNRWLGEERISADIEVASHDRGERHLVLRIPNL